jgi:hypothetical protein
LPVALEDSVSGNAFMALADELIKKVDLRNAELEPTEKLQITK